MKIFFRSLAGAETELDVDKNVTIAQVKQQLAERLRIRADLQKLSFNNKILQNKQTLADSNVTDGSVLQLIPGNKENSSVVAGGFRAGPNDHQFSFPYRMVLDDDQTMIIVDWGNHRIVEWKSKADSGRVLIGHHGPGRGLHQLNTPTDLVIDRRTNSLIICDRGNRRVVRWPRQGNAEQGEIVLENISCWGVALDQQGHLYVSDIDENVVKRYPYPPHDDEGRVVAGGTRRGMMLDELNAPSYIYVDEHQSVYVADTFNHRVMKWDKDARVGKIAARGSVRGFFVDPAGNVYVAGYHDHKIMRWSKEGASQEVTVRYLEPDEERQVFMPWSICCDQQRTKIFVGDHTKQRVQCFPLA